MIEIDIIMLYKNKIEKKRLLHTIKKMYEYFLLGYFYYWNQNYSCTIFNYFLIFILPLICPFFIDHTNTLKFNPENYICVYENEEREYIDIHDIHGDMDFMDCHKKDFFWLWYQTDTLNIKLFNDVIFRHLYFILIEFLLMLHEDIQKMNIRYKYSLSATVLLFIFYYSRCYFNFFKKIF
jgi:hypothetical protein